jgi:CheY-like chemotaxis protein
VRAEIWDTGAGIPADQLQRIFEEFHRLDHHDQQGDKCLGLGLAIADRIGRTLGHPITVHSRPGKGSVFAVAIPRGTRVPVAMPPPQPPPVTGSLADMRVLCVDNEPSIAEGMAALLRGWGCQVFTAGDQEEAEAVLAAGSRPDLMLADFRLDRGKNGLDLMDAVRDRLGEALPGVIITAEHGEELAEAVRARGYHFMNKPVKPAALRALLSRLGQRRPATGTLG